MNINVSVAMTTYNGAKYVVEQLDSIRTQTYSVDEVIIHDDKSTDDTVEIVKKYIKKYNLNSWHIQINELNMGFGDNFMNTIYACKGDTVFLADQDDIWYPEKVKETITFLTEHPDISCVASAYHICDSSGVVIDRELIDQWKKNDGNFVSINLDYFMNGRMVRGSSICFRKSILEDEPLYKVSTFGHDTLLSLYAIIKSRMVFYNKILFKYRVHDNNTSSVSLKKSSRFSKNKLVKRIKVLEDSIYMISKLYEHPSLKNSDTKIMTYRLDFMKKRFILIQKGFSIGRTISLVPYIKAYRASSQHGFIGGYYSLLTDICFSVMSLKWQGNTLND